MERPHPEEPRQRRLEGWARDKIAATASRSRRLFRARFDPRCPALLDRGRRECRMRVAPVAACAEKSTGVSNQGYTASAGIPCTMVLRLIRALPGDRALLPPSFVDRTHELSASVGAPEPHDFAVRDSLIRRAKNCACGYRVHRIPLPTSVTTAKRPSCGNGTARSVNLIWGHREAIYFCRGGWTGFCKA